MDHIGAIIPNRKELSFCVPNLRVSRSCVKYAADIVQYLLVVDTTAHDDLALPRNVQHIREHVSSSGNRSDHAIQGHLGESALHCVLVRGYSVGDDVVLTLDYHVGMRVGEGEGDRWKKIG